MATKQKIAKKGLEIKPFAKNAKKHPDTQLRLIAHSLKEFGWQQPIVVDKTGTIIVGHGRYLAYEKYLKGQGASKPWIVTAEDLTPEQVRAYRLADNKTNESEWDMALALEELKELDSLGVDIELLGFDSDLLIEPSEKDDIIPENPPPIAKLGDLWALGEHRVLCGDSTSKEAVERLMDGKKADMVFTDPPYGVNYTAKAERLGRKGDSQISGDESVDAASAVYGAAFQNISDNIKEGAEYYVCAPQGGDQEMMMMMMMRSTIPCRHQLIWKKDSPVFSMGRLDYDYQHEPILYGWRGSHHHIGGGKFKSSVWEIPRPKASKLHPTMKPVELIQEALLNGSKADDIVIDLFLGSGSTLIAAEKTGRICYGMELDPKYVDTIIKRWEDYTGQTAKKL